MPFLAPNFRRFNPFLAPNFRKTRIFAPDYQCITNYEKYLKRHIDNKVDCDGNSGQIKTALETLILAGLVYPVTHTSANGIPLGAEINETYRRMIFLDTGLLQSILGLNIADFIATTDMQVINRGAIAEIFVGNEIIKSSPCYEPRSLYCWHREKSGSNAEVDYVVQLGDKIRPIEVKSGIKGQCKACVFSSNRKASTTESAHHSKTFRVMTTSGYIRFMLSKIYSNKEIRYHYRMAGEDGGITCRQSAIPSLASDC